MYSRWKRSHLPTTGLLLLLLAVFAPACAPGNRVDQAEEANRLVDEMNAASRKAEEAARLAAASVEEMGRRDPAKEGDELFRLAQEQAEQFKQAGDLYREAADKAEQAGKLRTSDWFREYLALKAQQLRKIAEKMDVGREGAEVWLNEQDLELIAERRDQLGERAEKLSAEVAELTNRARKIEEERKDELRSDDNQNGGPKD